MRIGVIQASSQINKNKMLFEAAKRYAVGHEVINLGCFEAEEEKYSYIEVALQAGLLLASEAIDFVVTGCSSGQGMMLALNSLPGVICGYAPSPKDAYLFVQINNGNAISLPLGEEYTYSGQENLERTLQETFREPFGQGYPKSEAARKLKDTLLLKDIRKNSQISLLRLLGTLDEELIKKVLSRKVIIEEILTNGTNEKLVTWVRQQTAECTKETLLQNISKLHTTEAGAVRISKNVGIDVREAVSFCQMLAMDADSQIKRNGKNWYVTLSGIEITINAYNYSIITAHKV